MPSLPRSHALVDRVLAARIIRGLACATPLMHGWLMRQRLARG